MSEICNKLHFKTVAQPWHCGRNKGHAGDCLPADEVTINVEANDALNKGPIWNDIHAPMSSDDLVEEW